MKKRTDVQVGAVILLGIALVVFGTIWLKGAGFGRDEIMLEARVREAGNLKVGNTVKLRGVPIGRVQDIAFEPSGTGIIVRLRVDGSAPIPEDPVVIVSPESLFGDWQAEIHPRSRFPRYDFAESPDPNVLPGYSLPDMGQLTAVADEIARNLATLSDRVELAFTEETAVNVRKAIDNIQTVSEQLTGLVGTQQRAVEEVAHNLSRTTETLGEAAVAVKRAMAQVDAAVANGEIASIVDNVERATAQIDALSSELLHASSGLREMALRADTTLRAVGSIATRIERGEGSLGLMLADSTLYLDLIRTNALLQDLLTDFRANPRKYIKLEIF